ncbi:GNAT family N-acetyltransferase [Actinomadura atramentaria]|uniref:GNAT family N-acetyltransferase n=1 Tax=Actinomadura atramentaria TaxID=1990 RepID=UPI00036EDB59|nr:GNAT family protein [Actinomadura atramentaria]
MTDAWFDRPVLTGRYVRLEPLTPDHAEGLFEAGEEASIWTWLSIRPPADVAATRAVIEAAVADPRDRLAWAQIDAVTGEVAGTTSYYEISAKHRGLSIGYTWLGARWQRTGVNTESKFLLLERAFERLGAMRVSWHTDVRNARSRAAIERLGASFEGVHRRHRVRPDGTVRDTAVYALLDEEWPTARENLLARLH